MQCSIERDFLDRLLAGDVANYDEYKEYVFSKGLHYIQIIVRDGQERQLKRVETEYFRQMS